MPDMKVHHIGYAVHSIENALVKLFPLGFDVLLMFLREIGIVELV